jgi:hypothetical protein
MFLHGNYILKNVKFTKELKGLNSLLISQHRIELTCHDLCQSSKCVGCDFTKFVNYQFYVKNSHSNEFKLKIRRRKKTV